MNMQRKSMQSTDALIREALHKKILQHQHNCPQTIVLDELGLAHGKNRIDIAVINGDIHGYEIKSSKDNLSRFISQLDQYRKSLQKLTIVAAPNHIDEILNVSPDWCGVIKVEIGPRGGVKFKTIRRPSKNPSVDMVELAHLLWKKEAIELLQEYGMKSNLNNKNRKALYKEIANHAKMEELVAWIKNKFSKRETWRAV